MKDAEKISKCKSCGFSGAGNYCSRCGQSFKIKRITFSGVLHDIFHLFTHLEKGFFFTLKYLVIAPGTMQRTYIEGRRSRHQKPFSLFFICATITALSRYWILNTLIKHHHAAITPEATFFHEYMVVTYIALLPVYTLLIYLLFYKSGYNYAENGVLMLYTLSIFYLMSIVINSLILIWHELDTRYIELPVFALYFIITLMNYFKATPRWEVIIKSVIGITIAFYITQETEDLVIGIIN